jgi:hypothetical protein
MVMVDARCIRVAAAIVKIDPLAGRVLDVEQLAVRGDRTAVYRDAVEGHADVAHVAFNVRRRCRNDGLARDLDGDILIRRFCLGSFFADVTASWDSVGALARAIVVMVGTTR